MNRYPTEFAPRSWAPKLRPWLVRLCSPIRRYIQASETGLVRVDVRGIDRLQTAMKLNYRLLIAIQPGGKSILQRFFPAAL